MGRLLIRSPNGAQYDSPGQRRRCPGLSYCAPLGLKTKPFRIPMTSCSTNSNGAHTSQRAQPLPSRQLTSGLVERSLGLEGTGRGHQRQERLDLGRRLVDPMILEAASYSRFVGQAFEPDKPASRGTTSSPAFVRLESLTYKEKRTRDQ